MGQSSVASSNVFRKRQTFPLRKRRSSSSRDDQACKKSNVQDYIYDQSLTHGGPNNSRQQQEVAQSAIFNAIPMTKQSSVFNSNAQSAQFN